MILEGPLKKTIFISILGHITIFSIFSFSFGDKLPQAVYSNVAFLGAILRYSDLTNRQAFNPPGIKKVLLKRSVAIPIDKAGGGNWLTPDYYLKPEVNLAFAKDKTVFVRELTLPSFAYKKKESVIMFYPVLPYNFLLYFKDREVAHIELMFKIASSIQNNSIIVKRKISSGNLEADLLGMRYIGHYLFIQQSRFSPNSWQTVKIELKPKND